MRSDPSNPKVFEPFFQALFYVQLPACAYFFRGLQYCNGLRVKPSWSMTMLFVALICLVPSQGLAQVSALSRLGNSTFFCDLSSESVRVVSKQSPEDQAIESSYEDARKILVRQKKSAQRFLKRYKGTTNNKKKVQRKEKQLLISNVSQALRELESCNEQTLLAPSKSVTITTKFTGGFLNLSQYPTEFECTFIFTDTDGSQVACDTVDLFQGNNAKAVLSIAILKEIIPIPYAEVEIWSMENAAHPHSAYICGLADNCKQFDKAFLTDAQSQILRFNFGVQAPKSTVLATYSGTAVFE